MSNYCVYVYSDGEDVLYVGKTNRMQFRNHQHKNNSHWHNDNLILKTVDCDSDLEAKILEAELISKLSPIHNVLTPSVERIKILHNENINPSKQAKAHGLKSLQRVAEITGKPVQTLRNWSIDSPQLFKAVLLGCKQLESEK